MWHLRSDCPGLISGPIKRLAHHVVWILFIHGFQKLSWLLLRSQLRSWPIIRQCRLHFIPDQFELLGCLFLPDYKLLCELVDSLDAFFAILLFLETLKRISTVTTTVRIKLFVHKFPNVIIIRVKWRLREIFLGFFNISLEDISLLEIKILLFRWLGRDCSLIVDVVRVLWGGWGRHHEFAELLIFWELGLHSYQKLIS